LPKIAISYRRLDSAGITGRIFDRLAAHYGKEAVFIDIDNIPFGIDFRKHIQEQLSDTDVMLAIVGQRWLGEQNNKTRIKHPNDPVRIEVETALRRGIRVIPVLVDRATMPSPDDLPDTLQDFAYRNAAEVDPGRDFHAHVTRLINAMDKILAEKPSPSDELKAPRMAPGQRTPASVPSGIQQSTGSGIRNGTVLFYNAAKGYGFIRPQNGEKMGRKTCSSTPRRCKDRASRRWSRAKWLNTSLSAFAESPPQTRSRW
jgi:hypothetical protein